MKEFIKDVHYYLDGTQVVFTEQYHLERGYCCESTKGCRHCPYGHKGKKIEEEKKDPDE